MQIATQFRRVQRSLGRIARTRYPAFLFGLPLSQGEIPVFTYHDIEANEFAEDLNFLRKNGYRTLNLDEFKQGKGKADANRRVLLTFDDARRNFWEVAFPILRDFGARATLFVPTHWIGGGSETTADTNRHDKDKFMTWNELRQCSPSGIVDIQSHAHRHALVNISSRLVGFASPQALARYDIYDWPMRREENQDTFGYPPLGTPIYEAVPLLSASHRVIENETVVRACQDFVREGGGPEFFQRADWASQLTAVHNRVAQHQPPFRRISEETFRILVASEFQLCRDHFERELGLSPTVLAFPWMLGSTLSLQLAKEAGITTAFGVGLDFHRIRRLKAPIAVYGRLKADWLRFLPGRGRLHLYQVLPKKLAGFFRSQHLAH